MSANADDSPFVPASDLPEHSDQRVKTTSVEYANGTEALTFYAAHDDEAQFGTQKWLSAVGDSFVDLDEWR